MSATSQMRATSDSLRWTPAWVLLISVLTPASAWALHSVMPDLVAWYVGIMGWLILTPEKGLRISLASVRTEAQTQPAAASAPAHGIVTQPTTATEPADGTASLDSANNDSAATKAKKPRSRARKPKAMTLAEVKALTSSADRAVVWSQVGPGKFVRQSGDENSDQASDGDESMPEPESGAGRAIEAVVRGSTILDAEEPENDDDSNVDYA